MSRWNQHELTENHRLRDALLFLLRQNVASGETKEMAAQELVKQLEEKFPHAKDTWGGFSLAVREALGRGFIHFDTQTKTLMLSDDARAQLLALDIITSGCGASMVRVTWGATLYCHNCGGLM